MVKNQRKVVSYELKPRDIERHLFAWKQLVQLQKQREFRCGIVTRGRKMGSYHGDIPVILPRRSSSGILTGPRSCPILIRPTRSSV